MLRLIFKLLYTAVAFIETFIIFRIILDFINADRTNTLVSWIYNLSEYFIQPFRGITAETLVIDRFVIELTPIIALVFYVVIAFILSELIRSLGRSD